MFVRFIKLHGKEHIWKNTVLPLFGIAASVFMVIAALYAHGIGPYKAAAATGSFSCPVVFYLIVFAVIMLIGNCLYKKK